MKSATARPPAPSGILVVDKPSGPTSHDVVAFGRRAVGTRRIGHAGTLDPMATGVLVLAVEEATKLVPWLTSDDKAYEATLRLGVATDSLDAEGREVERAPLPDSLVRALARLEELDARHADVASDAADATLDAANAALDTAAAPDTADAALDDPLRLALAAERARTEQIPPAFSAIHVDGERAHELARRGHVVELPPRPVAVRRLAIVGGGLAPEPHLRVTLDVAKGYFVRSFARDFARALGTVGHLTALRRTRSGTFTLDDAVRIDPRPGSPADDLRGKILPIDRAVAKALPVSVLSDRGVLHARDGKRIAPEDLRDPHPTPSAWLDAEGRLVAVGEVTESGEGRVLRGFGRR